MQEEDFVPWRDKREENKKVGAGGGNSSRDDKKARIEDFVGSSEQ